MAINSPQEIADNFSGSASVKDAMPTKKLIIYSILGGAYIALGGLLAIIVAGGSPELASSNPGLVKFLFGAVFPIGLIMVVIGGAELFTSDCAVMPMGALNKQVNWIKVVRLWTIVYLGNFVGAILVAYFFAYSTGTLQADPWLSFTHAIAEKKTTAGFFKVFVKGVGANWLVCLAVWMAYAAKDVASKAFMIWVPVMAFVAMGYEHSIANMFFIPTAMFYGFDLSFLDFVTNNLVPATLGNIVGGIVFVAFAYYYVFLTDQKQPEMKTTKQVELNTEYKIKTKTEKL